MVKNYSIIIVLSLIMISCLIYGISESGSPWDSRGKKFDQTRISDLGNIKYSVDSYYSAHQVMPATLNDLKTGNTTSYYKFTDPETNKDYEYKSIGATSYQLCADFSQPTDTKNNLNYNIDTGIGGIGPHPKGHYCYDLAISTGYLNKIPAYPATTPIPSPNLTGTPLAKCGFAITLASGSATLKNGPSTDKLQIMGIYENADSVIFTTNKITNASIDRWAADPKTSSGFYYYGSQIFDSKTNGPAFDKVTGYRIKLFDPLGNSITSADYIFQGNRTVIADPRCP